MQATLDSFALKRLHRALTCLTKYGDELTIYATPEILSLSTTNSSMSAYCHFKYEKGFFSRYALNQGRANGGGEIEEVENAQGQLLTKSLLSVLKHRTVEKSVERCDISITEGAANDQDDEDTLESRLTVKLYCKHGVTKTHRLLLQTPTSILTPSVPSADIPDSHLIISAHAVKDMLEPFASSGGDPQLIWTFSEEEVMVRSWDGGAGRGSGDGGIIIQLATELRISAEEFEGYEICEGVREIGFHLKEFNATVSYADSMSLPLSLHFANQSGTPLFIEIEGEDMQGLFVISTSDLGRGPSQGAKIGEGVKKRPREGDGTEKERVTPRMRKPTKVVQRADQDMMGRARPAPRPAGSASRDTSKPHLPLSQTACVQALHAASDSQIHAEQDALFFPSQASDSGLVGVEVMTAAELDEMLGDEGEDVSSGNVLPGDRGSDGMDEAVPEETDWDDMELDATQMDRDNAKPFRPLFED